MEQVPLCFQLQRNQKRPRFCSTIGKRIGDLMSNSHCTYPLALLSLHEAGSRISVVYLLTSRQIDQSGKWHLPSRIQVTLAPSGSGGL